MTKTDSDSEYEEMQSLIKESPAHFLEILLVETEVDTDHLTRSCEALSSRDTLRFDYLAALLITKLEIMHSRRYAFADATQYEKACVLKHRVHKLLAVHWMGRDPIKVIEDKWQELQTWMNSVEAVEEELQAQVKRVLGIPGERELESVRTILANFLSELPERIARLQHQLPTETVESGRLLSDLAEYAILRKSHGESFEKKVSLFARLHPLVFPWRWDETHPLVQCAQSHLDRAQELISVHSKHLEALGLVEEHYRNGNINEARRHLGLLGSVRFPDINYETLRHKLSWAEGMRHQLKAAKSAKAYEIGRNLLKQFPGMQASSQLYEEAMAAIKFYRRWRLRRRLAISLMLMIGGVAIFWPLRQRQELSRTQNVEGAAPASLDFSN